MKRYIKLSTSSGTYIGGKLSELDYNSFESEDAYYDAFWARTETQSDYISTFADYYIIYRPDESNWTFDLSFGPTTLYATLTESMSIKEGVDVIAFNDHIDVIAYYGSDEEVAHLYPISEDKANELSDILDNSDFDYSTTIEMEIAQYTHGGASIEHVLKSWA